MTEQKIKVKSWDFYLKSSEDDPLQPFTTCISKGLILAPTEDKGHLEYGGTMIGSSQILVKDSDWPVGRKSGYLKVVVKNGYTVRLCVRVMKYPQPVYINTSQRDGKFHQLCKNESYTERSIQQVRIRHSENQASQAPGCTEFEFKGGDTFHIDIDGSWMEERGEAFHCRIIRNGEAILEQPKALDEHLLISIHSISKTPQSHTAQEIADIINRNQTSSQLANREHDFRQQIVEKAKTYLNDPYYWGGNTPKNEGGPGTDCSGFVLYVLNSLFNLNWKDMSSAKMTEKFDQVAIPEVGDLVFFKNTNGRVVQVDFVSNFENNDLTLIGAFGGDKNTKGQIPTAKVQLRLLSSDTREHFFGSLDTLFDGHAFERDIEEFSTINLNNPDIVRSIQLLLRSFGLFNEKVTGKYCNRTKQGVKALRQICCDEIGDDVISLDGDFDEDLLNAINRYQLDFHVPPTSNIQTLYTRHQANEEAKIVKFDDPFSTFEIHGHHHFDDPDKLTLKHDGGGSIAKIVISQGWTVRMSVRGPPNYLTNSIPDGRTHPYIGNFKPDFLTRSYIEVEMHGGDVLYLRINSSCDALSKPQPNIKEVSVGEFYLTLNMCIVTNENTHSPNGDVEISILSARAPTMTDWTAFSKSRDQEYDATLPLDETIGEKLVKVLELEKHLEKLTKVGNQIEAFVDVSLYFTYAITSTCKYTITKLDGGKYQVETQFLFGGGVEYGIRSQTWSFDNVPKTKNDRKTKPKFAVGKNTNASFKGFARLFNSNAYIFQNTDAICECFPFLMLSSVIGQYPAELFTGTDLITQTATDSRARWRCGLNFQTEAQVDFAVNVDLPILNTKIMEFAASLGGKIDILAYYEDDYTTGKSGWGLSGQIAVKGGIGFSLGIMEHLESYGDGLKNDAGETEDFNLRTHGTFDLRTQKSIRLSTSFGFEIRLMSSNLGPDNANKTKDPIQQFIHEDTNTISSKGFQQKMEASVFDNRDELRSVKLTASIGVDDVEIQCSIMFDATLYNVFQIFQALITESDKRSIFVIMADLTSPSTRFENVCVQVEKISAVQNGFQGQVNLSGRIGAGINYTSKIIDVDSIFTNNGNIPTAYRAPDLQVDTPEARAAQLREIDATFNTAIREMQFFEPSTWEP